MSVTELLFDTLESLGEDEFPTFKWRVSNYELEGFKPIPHYLLKTAERYETVTKLTKNYGDETAVTTTVNVLRKMNQNAAAQALAKAYKGLVEGKAASSTTSSSSPPAAPAAPAAPGAPGPSVSADNKSVVIVPNVSNLQGPLNITINNS